MRIGRDEGFAEECGGSERGFLVHHPPKLNVSNHGGECGFSHSHTIPIN